MYNREDEDFSAVNVEAIGRKKLAASTQRRTVVTSLGLQNHRRKKRGWGNTVSSPDARDCPGRDIPHHLVPSNFKDLGILRQLLRIAPPWRMHERLLHIASSPVSAKQSQVHLCPHMRLLFQHARVSGEGSCFCLCPFSLAAGNAESLATTKDR